MSAHEESSDPLDSALTSFDRHEKAIGQLEKAARLFG
jgi:hypothetical protein